MTDKMQKAYEVHGWRWSELISAVKDLSSRKVEAVRKVAKSAPKSAEREVTLFVSDCHFGSVVDNREVPSEKYDYSVANARMQTLIHELKSYKPHHRNETTCRLLFGGDLIENRIHGPSNHITALSEQIYFAMRQLTNLVHEALDSYGRVSVTTCVGNHDRWPDIRERALAQKYDSIATLCYLYVRDQFTGDPRVTVDIPRTPWTEWFTPGGGVGVLSHGDSFVNAGSVGKVINVGAIASQIHRFNAKRERKAEVFAMGHLHRCTYATLDDGTSLIVNGALIGSSPYAQSLGIVDSDPIQALWESVPGHVVGDFRMVRVDK